MIELSRTQIEALSDLRYSSRRARMHYNTRRSLQKLGLARWINEGEYGQTKPFILTEAGRIVIDTLGQLIEGMAPLGKDELDNQIAVLTVGGMTIDLGGSY